MDKEKQVLEMAKILCPKGTANCEKCSKNYKCDVKFSQLAELFDGGCQIVGEDEIVVKKEAYEKFVGQLIEQEEIAHSYEQGYAELLQSNHFLQDKLENARQETTREILQYIHNKKLSKAISEKYGIELE